MASSSPESILEEAMKLEKQMEVTEAELSQSKQQMIDHLKIFCELKSLGESLIEVADAAEELKKLMSSENNDEHVSVGLRNFDSLAALVTFQVRELSPGWHNLDSNYVGLISNFQKLRCEYTQLKTDFEDICAELKNHSDFVPRDFDGSFFMDKYIRKKISRPTGMYFLLD